LNSVLNWQEDVIQVVLATLQSYQVENRDGLKRVHERLDLLIGRDYVPREDCERYRQACKTCIKEEIKKVSGYPAWIVVLFSVTSSLIVFITTYSLLRG